MDHSLIIKNVKSVLAGVAAGHSDQSEVNLVYEHLKNLAESIDGRDEDSGGDDLNVIYSSLEELKDAVEQAITEVKDGVEEAEKERLELCRRIQGFTRPQLVRILEEGCGCQCYDSETDETLRVAILSNLDDDTIDADDLSLYTEEG
jgi:hypothetical protein